MIYTIKRNSWQFCQLGDAVTLQRGMDLPVSQRGNGSFPVVGSNGIVGTHDTAISEGPGVIVGRSGSVGRVTWINEPFWPLNTTLWVKDFHGNDPLFVYYLLRSLTLQDYATGVSVPTLNRNLVHPLPIFLPPFDEQQQIARILSTIWRALVAAKRVLNAAYGVTASVRSQLFESLSQYPEIALSNLVDPKRTICYGIVQPGPAVPDGVPYINVVDILNGEILMGGLKKTSSDIDDQHRRSRVTPGDVILTIRGTHDRVTQVPDDAPVLNLSRGCALISKGSTLPARYIYHWLQTARAQSFLRDHFRGVALRQVNLRDLDRMPVPTPPWDTAVSIAHQLDAAENHCARLRAEVEAGASF